VYIRILMFGREGSPFQAGEYCSDECREYWETRDQPL